MFSIGNIALIPLVLGWVQFAKEMGLTGKGLRFLAVVLGCAAFAALRIGEMYPNTQQWIEFVIFAAGGGLAATGLYDLGKQFLSVK
jgi:hypothetical protein